MHRARIQFRSPFLSFMRYSSQALSTRISEPSPDTPFSGSSKKRWLRRDREAWSESALRWSHEGLEMARLLAYSFGVKQQSLSLRLPPSVLQWIEAVRGDTDRADYIVGLLTERMEQERIETKERERW